MNNLTNNTTERIVAIEATKPTSAKNKAVEMSMARHSAMVKRALKSLYSVAPVYRMIVVKGLDEEGNLVARVYNTIGSNSPVSRAFMPKNKIVANMDVVEFDMTGAPSYRTVQCGVDVAGKTRYEYTQELVLVKFELQTFTEEQKRASEVLINKILAEGLSIIGNSAEIGKVEDKENCNVLVWTPSNERNGQMLMTTIDHKEAWERLEEIGGRAITKKLNAGGISPKKFAKIAKRLGLFAAPSIEFNRIGNDQYGVLLINSEILGAEDYNKEFNNVLKSVGIKIDNNQWDGAFYLSNKWMADGLRRLGVPNINAKQATMFGAQMRASVLYSKVFGEALSQRVMNRLVKVLTEKFAEDYNIVGNKDNICMILDSNGAKMMDLEADFGKDGAMVYLLDLAKGTQSATANQATYKYATANADKVAELYRRLAKEECHEYANSIGDDCNGMLDAEITPWQLLMNIAKNNPDSELANNVFTDKHLIAKLLKDVTVKHESAFRKGRIKIDSLFQRALFDITHMITEGKVDSLLKMDHRGALECYSSDVLEEKAAEIESIEQNKELTPYQKEAKLTELLTATIVKYPTPGMEEIELVVFKTENQMKRRIAELFKSGVIDAEEKDCLFEYFVFTAYGTIKMAADNTVKHKLAGMDTDYDGVVVTFEKELVDIIVKVYEDRANKLEESTGLVASHGGMVPYIDCEKNATDFLQIREKEKKALQDSTAESIGKWGALFK